MISLAENCDESGLEWVTNYEAGRLDDWSYEKWIIQGEPRGTGAYSSLELKRMGMVGLYRAKKSTADIYAEGRAAFEDGVLLSFCEPSVLQEHANLIAKLDEAEGDGWWGDFGYFNPTKAVFINGSPVYGTNTGAVEAGGQWGGAYDATPASDRNGIANEAMRQAMTQKPAAPEPPKPQAPEGVLEVAPMGRNPRGWGP